MSVEVRGQLVAADPLSFHHVNPGAPSQVTSCGGLARNGSHRPTGSAATRTYGLVGVGVAFLEQVCHWGQGLRSQMLKVCSVAILFLLPVDPHVELSAGSRAAPCLPACRHTPCHDSGVSL